MLGKLEQKLLEQKFQKCAETAAELSLIQGGSIEDSLETKQNSYSGKHWCLLSMKFMRTNSNMTEVPSNYFQCFGDAFMYFL